MNRGAIYWINLEPASPPEIGKLRPAIVISNSTYNERLDSIVVLPISSRAPEIWPLRLEIALPKMKKSYVIVPGVRQVSKSRLVESIGQAPSQALSRIREALAAYLGE